MGLAIFAFPYAGFPFVSAYFFRRRPVYVYSEAYAKALIERFHFATVQRRTSFISHATSPIEISTASTRIAQRRATSFAPTGLRNGLSTLIRKIEARFFQTLAGVLPSSAAATFLLQKHRSATRSRSRSKPLRPTGALRQVRWNGANYLSRIGHLWNLSNWASPRGGA